MRFLSILLFRIITFLSGKVADYYGHLRIFGVLQRIALSYALAGTLVLWLKKPRRICIALGVLLLSHWAALYFFGGTDPYSKETNIAGIIDLWLLGDNHIYHGYGLPFDPEAFWV
jgi:predicted acyltransferase